MMNKIAFVIVFCMAVLVGAAQSCDTIVVDDNNYYLEDFSTSPACWNLMPGPNSWGYSNGCLHCDWSYYEYASDAITPIFDISELTTPYLQFAYQKHNNGGGYITPGDYLTVSFRNAGDLDSVWIPLKTFSSFIGNWRYDSVALPTDMTYIQLKFTCVTRDVSYGIRLDNVKIYNNTGDTVIPINPSVTTRPTSGLTIHSATMNAKIWNPCYTPITSIGFAWKPDTDSNYTIVFADTAPEPYLLSPSPSYTLEGLDAGTTYSYHAFITYNDTMVFGDEVSFITFGCEAPTGLHATDVGLDYFLLEWDNDTNVRAWRVTYYGADSGIPDGGELVTETNSATIHYTFLTMDMHHQGFAIHSPLYYYFAVQAECSDSIWGLWSDTITVATPYVGIEERLQKAVTLYPNPTASYVNIRADGDVSVKRLEVYDVYGKVVRTEVEANNDTPLQTRIDVSDLSPGMYFVRVSTDLGPITKPFVKK